MNIQDIADFIDLVKNPQKYEARLQALKEEQERLNAVIETVGKASELDKLRKQVEKEKEQLQTDFNTSIKEQEKKLDQEVELLTKKRKEYEDGITSATLLSQTAEAKLLEAKKLLDSFSGREKALKQGEDSLRVRQEQLEVVRTELHDRLTKIRSVMG